jgi:hypothetical protein
MLAEGASFNTIKRMLQTSAPTIIRWKQRFLESGIHVEQEFHMLMISLILGNFFVGSRYTERLERVVVKWRRRSSSVEYPANVNY